jgi:hypothetical protein
LENVQLVILPALSLVLTELVEALKDIHVLKDLAVPSLGFAVLENPSV